MEKSSRQELEKNLMKAIEELTNTKVKSAELTEENSKISWELQKLEREKKVIVISCWLLLIRPLYDEGVLIFSN